MLFERRILVGVDGRERGHDAVALAGRLAEVTGADLLLAHVYTSEGKWTSQQRAVQKVLREHNHAVLDEAIALVPPDVRVRASQAVIGSTVPAPALCGLALEQNCDGLAVGSSHRHLAGRVIIGSTGELLLSGAGLPVAVAPEGFVHRPPKPFFRIVAAFDGSPESEAALAAAARFAAHGEAHLRVISVADHRPLRHGADTARLEECLSALNVEAEIDLLDGDPAARLIEACGVSDLVFAGSRGHGPLRDELPGAVSAKLIRSCDCPVIVLPRGQGAAIAETAAAAKAT